MIQDNSNQDESLRENNSASKDAEKRAYDQMIEAQRID